MGSLGLLTAISRRFDLSCLTVCSIIFVSSSVRGGALLWQGLTAHVKVREGNSLSYIRLTLAHPSPECGRRRMRFENRLIITDHVPSAGWASYP